MRMLVTTASRRCLPAVGRWTITGKPTAASDLACRSSSILYDSLLQIGSSSSYNDHYFSSSSPRLIGVRSFSTTPPGKEEDDDSSENIISRSLRKVVTPRNQFYALVAGGAIGTYAISRVFLGVTSFFTHLNPSVVAKWGFYTGFGCATMVGGLALVTAENMYIRADPVYRYCLNWVQNDTVVQKSLGDGIKAGGLRSYRLDAGKIEMVGTKPVWRPPRIQMIFDVAGTGPPYRTGLVTCEAIKTGGFPPKLTTTLLKVDFETGNEGEGGDREEDQTIFLKGSAEDLTRVSRRSGLSLEMLARQVHINRAAAGRQD